MNDFATILIALGRGIIKILISGLTGFGVALLVIGITTAGRPDMWRGPPPGELFMGIGAGLLSGGGMLLVLFFLPLFLKRPVEPTYQDDSPIRARPAPRPVRREQDDSPMPRSPSPRLASRVPQPDLDEEAPMVHPAPPPPAREEPGSAGFFEK